MRKIEFILFCLSLVSPSLANTYIVDQNGFKDFTTIQEAINVSWHGDTIIVNPGTYGGAYFNGKAITLASLDPNNSSIISSTIISGVIFDFGETANSIITGFTITTSWSGAGVKCYASSPTITKNVITGCTPAICGLNNACPTISRNIIFGNGGYKFDYDSTNESSWVGGTIFQCNGLIANNVIAVNRTTAVCGSQSTLKSGKHSYAYAYGGALYQCNGIIVNNTIVGNIATARYFSTDHTALSHGVSLGGALYQCTEVVKNNVIANNEVYNSNITHSTLDGGGIYGKCHSSYNDFWNNTPNNFAGGAIPGIGDLVADPIFADDGWRSNIWILGDYHLKSEVGRWDPNTRTWVIDNVTSLCIDAGDPSDSIGYEPNPNGGRINIGAYGGTIEASKSPSGIIEPVCTKYPAMDFNKDCKVDFIDFAKFVSEWLICNLEPPEACWE